MDFRTISLSELADQIQRREVSSREVVQHALDRIEATKDQLGAFVAVHSDEALAQAGEVDAACVAGEELGPLAGIPIGVKDLEDAKGFVTTSGSMLRADDAPAVNDSILVDRLRQAGCIVVGKTNTPEFGWIGDTTNRLFGSTHNPWNLERSAGGSSGGSASAVAAGLVPLATASDGGGSIRIPASVCGLPGFKSSLGRIPMGGPNPPGWPGLSVKGVLTNSVADTAMALDLVIGPDPSDVRSVPMPDQSWIDCLDDMHLPRRVVWSPTLGYAPVDGEILSICEAALARISDAGVEVVTVETVFDDDPVGEFLILSGVGNLRILEEFRNTPEWEKIDPGLAGLLEFAERISGVEYMRAQDAGHLLNLRLIQLFHAGTFLLTPTVAGQTGPPGGVGMINSEEDANWVRFTYPFNLTRSPAGSIPAGLTADGMPVGLQIVGPQRADIAVLRAMSAFEKLFDLDMTAPF